MKTFIEFLTAKGLTEEQFNAKTEAEKIELQKEYNNTLKSDFEAAIKGLAKKEEVTALTEKVDAAIKSEDFTAVKNLVQTLEQEIAALKEAPKVGKDRSMTPIKEVLLQNKEKIESLKSNGGKFEVEVDMEVSKATHNPTDITDRNELGQFLPGVSAIPYQRLYMQDTFRQGNASTEYIKYVQQATIVRDAKNVAACATSTHNSKVTFDIQDLQMKKLRDFTHVCIDMMEDYSFVESEIRNLVTVDLQLKKDSDILLADGTGANINGVAFYASTFSAAAVGADYSGAVADAQLIDLLVVAGAQIKAFGSQNFYMPNVIVLNPKDATLLGLLKDTQSNYITAGVVNAAVFRSANGTLFINGMMVMENPNCPENEAYIYDGQRGTWFSRRGIVVEFAYENGTNFEQELVTVKAYERGNLLVKNNDANAFMHIDDIAAGIAAITAS